MTDQRAPAVTAGVVGAFALVGFGVGLAQNFSLSFLIETLVQPGTNPMNNTLIGIVLVMDIFLPFAYGMLLAGGLGVVVGRAFADRRGVAAAVGGVGAGVGFLVFEGIVLMLTFSALSRYTTGGSGGGGPFGPSELAPVILQAAIPVAIVGAGVAYIAARMTMSATTRGRPAVGHDPSTEHGVPAHGGDDRLPAHREGMDRQPDARPPEQRPPDHPPHREHSPDDHPREDRHPDERTR